MFYRFAYCQSHSLTPTHFRSPSSVLNEVPISLSSMSLYCLVKNTNDEAPHNAVFLTLKYINPLNPELNPICYLLALLAHHFLHVSRIRVKSLAIRLLMSYMYIYGAPIPDVSRSHTTTHHSR